MKTKQVAVCFLYLFCSQYVLGVVSALADPFAPALSAKRRIVRREASCVIRPPAVKKLNECFDNIQSDLPDYIELPDQNLEEYVLSDGISFGWSNFRRGGFRCTCGKDFVRIHVDVDFLRILLSFVLNLLDDLLGGLLGPLGSGLASVLGNVVNLVVRILALRIIVRVVILQRFIPGTSCVFRNL